MNKTEFRKHIRSIKGEYGKAECLKESGQLCVALLRHEKITATETIICFWSMDDEICTHELVCELLKKNKRVLLPKVVSECDMTLHEISSLSDLEKGAYGIMEPVTPCVPISSVSPTAVCITPGMAFTTSGKRLGRGKGYYDRLFQKLPLLYKIGVCYHFQIADDLPTDLHDVMMDEVIYVHHQ